MCTKRLFGGPLVRVEVPADENDRQTHHYESLTGSWQMPSDAENDHG